MRRVIIDTDVASLSIKDRLPPTLLRELVGVQVGITFITLGELVRWATMRSWGPERRRELNQWLASRPTLPYTDDIARTWWRHLCARSPPRTTTAAERHLDRSLLPRLRPPTGDPEHQGLH
jgi:hypothetical protein